MRARPELDGRLLQPSNQLASEPDLADVFPKSDRIVDRFRRPPSRDRRRQTAVRRKSAVHGHPTEANALESETWRLELLVCGDNIKPERSFVTLAFDGIWPQAPVQSSDIWEHFVVDGPLPEIAKTPDDAMPLAEPPR